MPRITRWPLEPECARYNAKHLLAAMPNGCGSHPSRIRIGRILVICGHFFGLLAELVDPVLQ
jgi:hypothetical protein